jgi:2-polyprenyl-3-methyl-5-hydroxy-6-metoxy-1,4-benzoquinol methylase
MPSNFDRTNFQNKAHGFEDPVQLPMDQKAARTWQDANKSWWENTPMRYDWRASIDIEPGTKPYYDEIDRRFLDATRHYLPWKRAPFETLIPYAELHQLDVLEIGVGQGTHAQLIAPHTKSFTGIDLTESARVSTRRRFDLASIDGAILQMDAEIMLFPHHSFDFIWSWGVIHHSSNTQNIIREMHRVLRPGGYATVMVYHRSILQYYLINGILRGLLRGEFWKTGSIHRINQAATDGALARFFSVTDFAALVGGLFSIENYWITGQKPDAIPLPNGTLKNFLIDHLPDVVTRFMTDRIRLGTFLIVRMRRA